MFKGECKVNNFLIFFIIWYKNIFVVLLKNYKIFKNKLNILVQILEREYHEFTQEYYDVTNNHYDVTEEHLADDVIEKFNSQFPLEMIQENSGLYLTFKLVNKCLDQVFSSELFLFLFLRPL